MSLINTIYDTIGNGRDLSLRLFINTHIIKEFGVMTTLQIDAKNKTAHLTLDLKGETTPIEVDVGRYWLETENGQPVIKLADIKTSREWITVAANLWAKDGHLEGHELLKMIM